MKLQNSPIWVCKTFLYWAETSVSHKSAAICTAAVHNFMSFDNVQTDISLSTFTNVPSAPRTGLVWQEAAARHSAAFLQAALQWTFRANTAL